MSSAYSDLNEALLDIENRITDAVDDNSITPTIHGDVLERLTRTVFAAISAGSAGASLLAGTGAPDGADGNVNDHYLRYETGQLYKKTGASTWTDTGYTLKGNQGLTGATGAAGANGANGASPVMRLSGTELQWKLATQNDASYASLYDVANLKPVLSLSNDLEIQYRLTGETPGGETVLYDMTELAPVLRVNSGKLQYKLAVQDDADYQDLLNLNVITPVFRNNSGTLEYKYASEDDSAYRVIGSLSTASSLDGDVVSIDVALTNITPDVTPAEVSTVKQLGAIIKGIDNSLSGARIKMRTGEIDAADVTAHSHDFSVQLTDAANAQIVLDGSFVDPSWYSVSSAGLLTWPSSGSFEAAVSDGSLVILLSA